MDASARRSFHIGRYHCVEALAHTPLGETFRAKVYGVAGLERQYALKQIDASVRVEAGQRARLVDAARRYATLEHERIARLTEIHDEGEECWLVTDLARGIDLPRLVTHLKTRGESLPVDQAILVAVDIAEALAAAERSGILHEGLWPSTIMVLGEGEVRVSDFAIAGALERPGWVTDDALVSVLAYAAPERLRGAGALSSSDTWSLGAIAFELATGAPLYTGTTIAELGAARSQGPAWDKLPLKPGLREALARLLHDDPTQRPASASHARELLAGLLGMELARARQGLQSLAKRALGRALTRTGSFAAVAIPSTSLPTLAQDTPAAMPADSRPRTLMGLPTHAAPATPAPKPEHRAWSPPRKTTPSMPVAREEHTTLPGLGVVSSPEVAAMEIAELPPDVSTGENTAPRPRVEPASEESLSFDDEIETAERERPTPPPAPELTTDGSAQIELTEAFDVQSDEPTRVAQPAPPPVPVPAPANENLPPPPRAEPIVDLPSLRMTAPAMVAADRVEAMVQIPRPLVAAGVDSGDFTPLPPPQPASTLATQAALNPVVDTAPTSPAPARPIPVEAVEPARLLALPTPNKPLPAVPGGRSGLRAGVLSFVVSLGVAGLVGVWCYKTADAPKPNQPIAEMKPAIEPPKPAAAPVVEVPVAEAPKVATETPKVATEAPKVATETPKVATETPKVATEGTKVATATPKVATETPKVATETPKVATEGTKVATETTKVATATPKPVAETPAPVAAANSLALTSTPPGATVWLDGTQRGVTPLSTTASAGEHKLVLVAQGKKLLSKTVKVGPDGLALELPLEPAKLTGSGDGGLKVRCHTTGELRILLDGVDTGLTCPNDVRIPAEPGSHQIGLYSPRTGETHEVDGEVNEDPDHSTRIYVRY